MPQWMMRYLHMAEDAMAQLCVARVAKADSCTLQPRTPAFFALRDHRRAT